MYGQGSTKNDRLDPITKCIKTGLLGCRKEDLDQLIKFVGLILHPSSPWPSSTFSVRMALVWGPDPAITASDDELRSSSGTAERAQFLSNAKAILNGFNAVFAQKTHVDWYRFEFTFHFQLFSSFMLFQKLIKLFLLKTLYQTQL